MPSEQVEEDTDEVCSKDEGVDEASSEAEENVESSSEEEDVDAMEELHYAYKQNKNLKEKVPVLFLKPTSSYVENGGTIEIPHPLQSLDYEVELAVVIGKKARDVKQVHAMDYVEGYALALDMTAREIQNPAKAAGLPWTVAKGYDNFTPISTVISKSTVSNPDDLELWLKVDNQIKQKGSTKDMIFKIPNLISHISSIMTLFEGDVILTGTPPGVGPVMAGQKITTGITGLIEMSFDVQPRQVVVA